MKKKIISALMVAIMCATPCNAKVINIPKGIYPHMGIVTKVHKVYRNIYHVTFRDAASRIFSWYDDDPSWFKGDFVSVIMYDNGTKKVKDDIVIDARYVGYKGLF